MLIMFDLIQLRGDVYKEYKICHPLVVGGGVPRASGRLPEAFWTKPGSACSQLSGFGSQLTVLSYHFGLCLPHLLQLFLHPLVLPLCAPSCWCYCLLGMTHLFELSSTTVSGWLASRTSPTGPQPCCSHPLLVASPIRTWRPLIHVVHSPSLLCPSVYTITAFISLSWYYVLFKLKSFIQSAAWVLSAVMDSSLCRCGA